MAFPPHTGYSFVPTIHRDKIPLNLHPDNQTLPTPFVVCITGASRNIGAGTAKAFAAAGATGLILTARTEAALQKTVADCKAIARSSDLKITTVTLEIDGSPGPAKALTEHTSTEHGRLDCLINNAGLMASHPSAFGRLEDVEDDQFSIPIQINLVGRMLITKYCLPLLIASPNPAVVNITSLSSHLTSGTPVPFNISELGTNRFTESLAEQYAEQGLMAYAVHPGTVKSDFPLGFPEHFAKGCVDDPGLCGAFLTWLVRRKREWLSGRYLAANWDVQELEGRKENIVERDLLKRRMTV